jgi:4-hydroxybenzoate polyprenyltransferase
MNHSSSAKTLGRFYRLKLFFALSRTPHGLLDMTTPAFAALLYLGTFPPIHIVIVGALTAFAGYTAVYALNDVVDFKNDQEKCAPAAHESTENYLDSLMVRHPMAQGLLTYRQGLMWTAVWTILALVGAYILNPMCVVIFLCGAALETVYCLLWRVSPWRAVINGLVKNSGPVAALFAVDPHPSLLFTGLIFISLFFWEIGGQNIPADWTDLDVDRRHRAQTIPIRLGTDKSALLALVSLVAAVVFVMALFLVRFPNAGWAIIFIAVAGVWLLILPAIKLYRTRKRESAMFLFNRASYFPLSLLLITLVLIISAP